MNFKSEFANIKLKFKKAIEVLKSNPLQEEIERLNGLLEEKRLAQERAEQQVRIEQTKVFELERHNDYFEAELERTKLELRNLSEIESGMDLYLYKTPEKDERNDH
ncbi:hypothetical protein A2662_03175 [Candidatus Giovannonibacteria bacterium RIFCSPHIGHO2_01_FULL_45_33]|uniref:Uncharacterized protein n=1 Tax=Candidatus Giovannonibacteria bacterium RIFCSPLOWO2_01_FULL_45_34 TaxID=1798351 RepID=A0A1F5WYY7_9BACT|nr:MAG: hypothetical protein A2662_03175 [Candidatus Giovannonibacteria bacterium RIFCSPHIGHO2_01_FULL_45_33]OGF70994.1 MAG: hypothetical protein A3C73_04190 [Candidatus Giovannonibacteria bacterium RIFCSPHIGHO2_02_FULL_44_11]OGF80864.1 MAG: hypothetical protein A2930_03435 [Candidatus Giovannonibacteria bacterium RIFCSPLOWO2_01_FULL_45_34]